MREYLERYFFRPREKKEVLVPEKTLYMPNFDVIVFSGFSGTGKTSTGDAVNEVIIGTQYVKVGQKIRTEVADLLQIPPEKDFDIDVEQEKLMINTINAFPLILESRLGPVIGADILARMADRAPRIVRILITAEEHARHMRVWNRDRQDNPDLTLEESIAITQRRDEQFVKRMQMLYPELLRGQHPFDPDIKDKNGNPVYDLIIDTTFVSIDKAPNLFIGKLLEKGLLREFKRTDFGEGKAGDMAFEKVRSEMHCEFDGCQRLSVMTVDSKTPDSIYSHGACSSAHADLLETDIIDAINEIVERRGVQTVPRVEFGRNGFRKAA